MFESRISGRSCAHEMIKVSLGNASNPKVLQVLSLARLFLKVNFPRQILNSDLSFEHPALLPITLSMFSDKTTAIYGLTALPADAILTPPSTASPQPVPISDLSLPSTLLATRIQHYVQSQLSPDTYRHSLRVYSYGLAIARQCYPSWNLDKGGKLEETWFLTAMLHDLGTTEENIKGTRLSYEFWAGVKALEVLQDAKSTGSTKGVNGVGGGNDGSSQDGSVADREQAESVCEAILRHQDVQDKGM